MRPSSLFLVARETISVEKENTELSNGHSLRTPARYFGQTIGRDGGGELFNKCCSYFLVMGEVFAGKGDIYIHKYFYIKHTMMLSAMHCLFWSLLQFYFFSKPTKQICNNILRLIQQERGILLYLCISIISIYQYSIYQYSISIRTKIYIISIYYICICI